MISEPNDAIICEGDRIVFACVLNKHGSISSNDVQWYRFIKNTSTTEIVVADGQNILPFTHTRNTINSSLTIANARRFSTGYYWVETPSLNVCNVSLNVGTSMYVARQILLATL